MRARKRGRPAPRPRRCGPDTRWRAPSGPACRPWPSAAPSKACFCASEKPPGGCRRGDQLVGYAVIVEEIGKHRPITFVVGVRPDGKVSDVAVMSYREAYGGEVKSKRFLVQYQAKSIADGMQPPNDLQNIAGATLS